MLLKSTIFLEKKNTPNFGVKPQKFSGGKNGHFWDSKVENVKTFATFKISESQKCMTFEMSMFIPGDFWNQSRNLSFF